MKVTRLLRPDFKEKKSVSPNRWYDLYEDWDLIDASFAAQYGIRLRAETEMSWGEFCTLLSGLMPETPLGQIVCIRSESNKDILKNFTPDQHQIRNEWRKHQVQILAVNASEMVAQFQQACKQAFGNQRR